MQEEWLLYHVYHSSSRVKIHCTCRRKGDEGETEGRKGDEGEREGRNAGRGGRGRGERLIVEHAASFLPECSHWCGGGRCEEGEESGQETSL